MNDEIWKYLSYCHTYKISNKGNVKSVDRECNHYNGLKGYAIKKENF